MKNNSYLELDGAKVWAWIDSIGENKYELSEKLGFSRMYLYRVVKTGRLSRSTMKMLNVLYGVTEEQFLPDPPKPEPVKEEPKQELVMGYHLDLQVHATKVKLSLMFGDEVIESAWAKILGNSEMDLVKSISYAAHMIYKHTEQNVLEHEA